MGVQTCALPISVNAALGGPPNNWDQDTIDHNMYTKYDVSQINGSEFDSDSVMLYSFPASGTLDGFHPAPNDELSELDQAFARHAYPGRAHRVHEVYKNPVVGRATQPDIGRPDEETRLKN